MKTADGLVKKLQSDYNEGNARAGEPLAAFRQAQWRGTTNVCELEITGPTIGISFDLDDGRVARFKLGICSARGLAETILEFLDAYRTRTTSQPESSSGSEKEDGSPQEGQKV